MSYKLSSTYIDEYGNTVNEATFDMNESLEYDDIPDGLQATLLRSVGERKYEFNGPLYNGCIDCVAPGTVSGDILIWTVPSDPMKKYENLLAVWTVPSDQMKKYENFLTVRVQYKGEHFVLARQFGEEGEVEFCNNNLFLNKNTVMEFDSINGVHAV